MEGLLSGGVTGAGYLLNGKNNRIQNSGDNIFKEPSQLNIYTSNQIDNIREYEKSLVNNNYKKAVDAIDTNIIPQQFNSKIINKENTSIKYLQSNPNDCNRISELSGNNIEHFNHNNMLPYFGSKVRQITSDKSNSHILGNHTGIEEFSTRRTAPKPLFEPTKDINIKFGTQNKNDEVKNRIVKSKFRTNELPFAKVNVGPGLDQGYCANPVGGFHPNTRSFILPKNIDDLRPKSDPQISYKGRVIPGKAPIGKTSILGKVNKNRPDTFFINNPDRYLTTTGSVLKPKQRSCIIVPETNRKKSKSYHGTAGPAVVKKDTKRSLYKKDVKNTYKTSGPRNAFDKGGWENENFGDYGKKSINLPAQERDITGSRTSVSNITTIVKALVAPILDVLKTTKKENAVGNIRQTGNIGTSGVTKNIPWDPNDVTRTTIKETNIHDNRSGNLAADTKGVAWDPNDVTRTTIKETNIHNNRSGNMNSDNKGVAWDPNDVTRTTIKETNIHNNRSGNMNSDTRGVAWDPNDITRTTIKETNIHNNRSGNMNSDTRGGSMGSK